MDWLILFINITFTSIAILLCVLSWITLKTIRHLNVGKTFWIPVFLSGVLFSIGSIIAIFNELGLSLASTNEIGLTAQLIALCFLSGGIYGYSKRIRKDLSEELIIPEPISTENEKMEGYIAPTHSIDKRATNSNNLKVETASKCNYQLGYLQTFPTKVSLPEECLSCDKLIECKHS